MSALIGLMLAFLGFMYLIWRLSCWIFDFDPRQDSFWKWLATGLLLSIFFSAIEEGTVNEDWEGEELADIEDPSLPDDLREHAGQFKNPGKVVIVVGGGEYVLYAADGELLDLCFMG
jgi:hypothetical protein